MARASRLIGRDIAHRGELAQDAAGVGRVVEAVMVGAIRCVTQVRARLSFISRQGVGEDQLRAAIRGGAGLSGMGRL